MYLSTSELASFDVLSPGAKCKIILTWVRALVATNRIYLSEMSAPPLYESGVLYKFQGKTDDWQDIPRALATGLASCNTLGAWRVAELNASGCAATPYIQSENLPGFDMFHVIVRWPDGTFEDPSRALGMPPA